MVSLTGLHLRAARARIAAIVTPPAPDPALGSIRLRDDQLATAARVAAALRRDGGCLLADDVGRGKTYVALAIARGWTQPLVVAPAALRSTWSDAMRRAGVVCPMVSHEALSRGKLPEVRPDGIVVDESHHFRSTNAKRYAALAALASSARLLLLSATPLQNRRRDLAAQVALFHGAHAFTADSQALAEFVVRSSADAGASLPSVAPPVWLHPAADDGAVVDAILALPSPARPSDGGDAGVLRTIGLVRAWASSRAALRDAIRRRRRIATAIEQSVAEGRVPTRAELSAWAGVDDSIQLGFASLLATGAADMLRAGTLADAVAREHAALARLEAVLAASADPDEPRVAALRRVRAVHAGARVLAFTELAGTARAYFARMRRDPGVGLLTASDARIASGRLPRDALLERFAPRARGAAAPLEREQVTLLIATDLLSEGVNLQDASVVVHLDLPWNPARLAQRVGRVRRPGGASIVHAYLLAPPARAEQLLDVEQRLRRKLGDAARTIGPGLDVVPRLGASADHAAGDVGHAALFGETAQRVASWLRPARASGHRRAIVAGVECADAGWLAALDDGRLVAALGGAPADTHASVARAVSCVQGTPCRPPAAACLAARRDCDRWIARHALSRTCGSVHLAGSLDVALDRRIARALERAPRHLRPALAQLASRLVARLRGPRSLGTERALWRLLDETDGTADGSWLPAAVAMVPGASAPGPEGVERARVVAMIILFPKQSQAWP